MSHRADPGPEPERPDDDATTSTGSHAAVPPAPAPPSGQPAGEPAGEPVPESGPRGDGSRRGGGSRRLDLTVALAVALPVLVALALVVVRPEASSTPARPAEQSPLARASLVCPTGGEGSEVTLASAGRARGSAQVTPASDGRQGRAVEVGAGGVTAAPGGSGAVVVSASDALAPELVAGRTSARPVAAADCRPVSAEQWFTGVGAAPTHGSTLELVNPNPGPAVAEVTVMGERGPVDAPSLRGVTVPGNSSQTLDLAQVVPQRGDLVLRVVVSRGQLGMSVSDRAESLTGELTSEEWMPAQLAPATRSLLMGLPEGEGERVLSVANPSDSEVTATLRLVTAQSVFEPADAPELTLPPESVAHVDLAALLGSDVAEGALGIEVQGTAPVASTLRSLADGDLVVSAPGQAVTEATTLLLPGGLREGDKRLVLAGADSAGVATVTAHAADGSELASQRVELTPDRGAEVELPADAVRVDVEPARTSLVGSVVIESRDGGAVVPLRPLVRTGLEPKVAPGLP